MGERGGTRQVGGAVELCAPSVSPTLQEPLHNQSLGSFLIQPFWVSDRSFIAWAKLAESLLIDKSLIGHWEQLSIKPFSTP